MQGHAAGYGMETEQPFCAPDYRKIMQMEQIDLEIAGQSQDLPGPAFGKAGEMALVTAQRIKVSRRAAGDHHYHLEILPAKCCGQAEDMAHYPAVAEMAQHHDTQNDHPKSAYEAGRQKVNIYHGDGSLDI